MTADDRSRIEVNGCADQRSCGATAQWMVRAGGNPHAPEEGCDRNCRPLVVIDPEDRERVERFARIYAGQPNGPFVSDITDDIQDALREFVGPNPPACGARISLDYGETGSHHECEKSEGHDGAHADLGLSWTTTPNGSAS